MNAEWNNADPSRSQLRGAIVGFGSIGRRHFENLASLGVTQCVVVRRKDQSNPAFNPPAETPVVFSDKAAIEMGVDFAHTMSCYDPGDGLRHCGRCDACLLRKKGFAGAGIDDPTDYAA